MIVLTSYLAAILTSAGRSTEFGTTTLQGDTAEGSQRLLEQMSHLKNRLGTWPIVGKAGWILDPRWKKEV
jgi:hypothetical protein